MRLFLAIELNTKTKRALAEVSTKLTEFNRLVRWVKPERMHVTVKFLGEVPHDRVPKVCDAAARAAKQCRSFNLTVDQCGCFPPKGRVRIIWAGSKTTPQELLDCAAVSQDEFAVMGFEPESRPFKPHMTLGRVQNDNTDGRLRDAVSRTGVAQSTLPVNQLTLFQSVLGRAGPDYSVVSKHPLGNT